LILDFCPNKSEFRACHTMANFRFCDKLIADRGTIAIRVPSHTIAITVRELLVIPAIT